MFALAALSISAASSAAELGILGPVIDNGHVAMRPDPHGRRVPLFRRIRDGALYARLQAEAKTGFTADMLALDEAAQRIGGTTDPHPTWLYLSDEEGGYARSGFWLDDRGTLTFVPDPFVDLVVDDDTVTSGEFEEIFAHELGHVLLRRLLPNLPAGYSRTPHSSLSITDEPTAFDEGFAIHFQALARRATRNRALRDEDFGLAGKPFVSYWLGRIDRAARIDGVRENRFVQRQHAMDGAGDALDRRDFSTDFDATRLKNGNQMLASEGVIATLFYRWLAPDSISRDALIRNYEPLLEALKALNVKVARSPHVLLDLIDIYRTRHPHDDEHTIASLIDTTYGAMSDRSMARETEQVGALGRVGDAHAFTKALAQARRHLAVARKNVLDESSRSRAALGPDIWLASDRGVSSDAEPRKRFHRAVNLNTAEPEELALISELSRTAVSLAIAARDRDGAYASIDDFVSRNAIDASAADRLRRRRQTVIDEGTYPRR